MGRCNEIVLPTPGEESPDKSYLHRSSFFQREKKNFRNDRKNMPETRPKIRRHFTVWLQAFLSYLQLLSSAVLASSRAKRKQSSDCWLKAGKGAGLPLYPNSPVRNAEYKLTQVPQILDGEWMNGKMTSSNAQCLSSQKTVFKYQSASSYISCFKSNHRRRFSGYTMMPPSGFVQEDTLFSFALTHNSEMMAHTLSFLTGWTTVMYTYGYLHKTGCSHTYTVNFSPVTVLKVLLKVHLY